MLTVVVQTPAMVIDWLATPDGVGMAAALLMTHLVIGVAMVAWRRGWRRAALGMLLLALWSTVQGWGPQAGATTVRFATGQAWILGERPVSPDPETGIPVRSQAGCCMCRRDLAKVNNRVLSWLTLAFGPMPGSGASDAAPRRSGLAPPPPARRVD